MFCKIHFKKKKNFLNHYYSKNYEKDAFFYSHKQLKKKDTSNLFKEDNKLQAEINFNIIREMEIKITRRYHFTLTRKAIIIIFKNSQYQVSARM